MHRSLKNAGIFSSGKTYFRANEIVAIDFFIVPTVTFNILYGFVVLLHNGKQVVHFNATAHPTALWTAQQIIEAFPEETAPRFLLRDRDSIYGEDFRYRVARMGIEEVITTARSPWQNPYAERHFGAAFRQRVAEMGIREVLTAPRSPWQNSHAERFIGCCDGSA
jgi:hypothetical protein